MFGKKEIVVVALLAGLVVWFAGEHVAFGKDWKIVDPGFNKNQINQPQINKDLLKQAKPVFKKSTPPPPKQKGFKWEKLIDKSFDLAGKMANRPQHHGHYGYPGGGYPGSGYPGPAPTMMLHLVDLVVAELNLDRDVMYRGELFHAYAVIANESDQYVRHARVRFFVGQYVVHEQPIEIAPWATAEAGTSIRIHDPGHHAVRVEVEAFGAFADQNQANNFGERMVVIHP